MYVVIGIDEGIIEFVVTYDKLEDALEMAELLSEQYNDSTGYVAVWFNDEQIASFPKKEE
jgi:hypothetical protein